MVAAIFCAFASVVFAYMAALVGAYVWSFDLDSPAAAAHLKWSLLAFVLASCAYLYWLWKMAAEE